MSKCDPNIAMPEIGPNAHLCLDVAGLETLEGTFGPKYYSEVMTGLDDYRPSVIKAMLAASLREGSVAAAMNALPPQELCRRLLDATLRLMYGRTLAETIEAKS